MIKITSLISYSKIIISFLSVTLIFLLSCNAGIAKRSSSNNGKSLRIGNDYTSYFVNDTTMLYYIKPIRFDGNNCKVNSDFTYNKINNKIKNVVMNFSVFSNVKLSTNSVQSISFNNKEIKNYKILFNEFDNKKNELRVSSNLNTAEFLNIDENSFFEIVSKELKSTIKPSKKAYSKLKNMNILIND